MLGVEIVFFLFFSKKFDLWGVVVSFAVLVTAISYKQNLRMFSIKPMQRD